METTWRLPRNRFQESLKLETKSSPTRLLSRKSQTLLAKGAKAAENTELVPTQIEKVTGTKTSIMRSSKSKHQTTGKCSQVLYLIESIINLAFKSFKQSDTKLENRPEQVFKAITGDLFTADSSFALAHCVSLDYKMGAGIAKLFREKYVTSPKHFQELKDQSTFRYLFLKSYQFRVIAPYFFPIQTKASAAARSRMLKDASYTT